MKESRLFRIVYELLAKEKCSAAYLADKMEVSIRTIYRDIDAISSAGIPIYATPGKYGGIALAKHFQLKSTLLSKQEQDEIMMSLQSLQVTNLHTEETLHKLNALFQSPIESWIDVDFTYWGKETLDQQKFSVLKDAILTKKEVTFTYFNANGKTAVRKIYPTKLKFKSKDWYVFGYCLDKQDYRLFKLHRLYDLQSSEHYFHMFPLPPVKLSQPYQDCRMMEATLQFNKQVLYRMYDEFTIHAQRELGKDTIEIDTTLIEGDYLIGFLLSFGSSLNVIKPTSLKQMIAIEIDKMYKNL